MSDPNINDVFSLIHFDGTNGSTTIVDEKLNGWTCVTTCNLSTAQFEAGTASLQTQSASSGRLQSDLPASDWTFLHDRSIDYTLEISTYFTALEVGAILDSGGGSTVNTGALLYCEANGNLHFGIMRGVDSSPCLNYVTASGALTANQWNKIRVVVKKDTGATLLVDGIPVASGTFAQPGASGAPTSSLWIGGSSTLPAQYYTDAFYDEFRVSKVALADSTYTPTVPFPDNSGPGDGFTPPPTITTQPVNLRVAAGALATFTVVSPDTDTYLWYENDVALTGETTATLSFTAAAGDDGNYYRCDLMNAGGTTASANANLAIEQNLAIIVQPKDVTARGQDRWQFTVEATGVNLTYQWYTASDNQPIAGETGSSYSGTAFALLNGYQVYVIVSDDSGSVQSNTVTLTVLPAIVTATTYLWYPDGFPCPEIEYGENVIGFTQPTLFDSGWQRLRRNYLDFIRDASFTFRMDSYEFGIWAEWAETDAYRDWWYIVVDDETLRCRFSSQLSWTYGSFDKIAVQVTAEVADYNADIS